MELNLQKIFHVFLLVSYSFLALSCKKMFLLNRIILGRYLGLTAQGYNIVTTKLIFSKR